jgi:S-adenosylmethionine synthetase
MHSEFVFTSESVTEGHPDKLCDQISDAILGQFLRQDPFARVVAECSVSTGIIFLSVKFASSASVDVANIARDVIRRTGYRHSRFNAESCTVITSITELPIDERERQDESTLSDQEIGQIVAADQVTLFGFACTQTETLMPLPIALAHRLAQRLTTVRKEGILDYLAPDGKTQVGVEFRNRKPARIHGVTLVASFLEDISCPPDRARDDLREAVLDQVFAEELIGPDEHTRIAINPHSCFATLNGPVTHAGLTGRKTGIDTYGEYARHSGSALSGKDPSRIDRSGAYIARYAAKNVVAAGLAEECEVLLSYAIGLSLPVTVEVETFNTGIMPDAEIARHIKTAFDFRPGGIIRELDLRGLPQKYDNGFYQSLAVSGQVGRKDLELPWERTDRTDAILDNAPAEPAPSKQQEA